MATSPPEPAATRCEGIAKLVAELASGERTSSEVTAAYLAQIERVNPQLRAVSQPLFDSARREAAHRDQLLAECRDSGSLPPRLCGVPITIKDCFDVQGAASSLGIATAADHLAAADSPLVARLRAAGAVIVGKTNVPQAMLLHSCDNPVYGRTFHPSDPQRGPGGSGGGDAAIVAAGGATLSLGSDLGGSIRQPAHACGVAGLKPTTGRLTNVGSHRGLLGMQAIAIQPGPLARRVDDLDLAMQALADKSVVPLQEDEIDRPWPDYRQVNLAGLRIGIWPSDAWFPTAPAIAEGVRNAGAKLEELGATVVEVAPQGMREAMRIYFGLVSADGLLSVRRMVKGSPVDWQLRRQLSLARLPRWLRLPLQGLLSLAGQRHLAELVRMSGPRSADAYWQLVDDADRLRREFWPKLDQAAGGPLDAVVFPPHALPALRHGTSLDLLGAALYCYLPNLIDAPAGVVPWGGVPGEQQSYPHGRAWDLVDYLSRRTMDQSAGLPIGVQVMGRKWREDVVLAVMAALER